VPPAVLFVERRGKAPSLTQKEGDKFIDINARRVYRLGEVRGVVMTFKQCERCGYGNEAGATVCEDCGAALGRGEAASELAYAPAEGGATPYAGAYAAGEAPAGRLPLDFAVRAYDSVGDVLGPTFRLYGEHLGTVAKIVLVAAPVEAVIQYFGVLMEPGGEASVGVLSWLVSTGVGAFVTGSLVHAVMTLLRTGTPPPARDSFAWGLRKWWKVMLVYVMSSFVIGLGSLLLCVPGLIAALVFAVAMPAAAAEDVGPLAAMKRSMLLTAGYRALIFITWLVVGLPLLAAVWLITATASPPEGAGGQFLMAFVYAAILQLIHSFNTTVTLFIYLSLRASRGEVDAPPLDQPAA
jgi:hypothetical protein